MNRSTVQSFLQTTFTHYQQNHRLPLYQIKAAELLMRCRTEALGGHSVYCEDGHLNGVWYNSCRHRSCPQCSALKSEQWQQRAEALLLNCKHHHWVFTLPHDLHDIWRFNREFCQQLLFKSVRETLQQLSRDPRYLGARSGFILALHTWARNQMFHPHIHCVISHGGLDATGKWKTPKRKIYLPANVMMMLFRGKYLGGLKEALKAGDLVVPTNERAQKVINLCNKLGRKDWVVHCVKAYEHGHGVAKYLARYIRGGAIKNSQILHISQHHIKIRYKSHQTQQTEYLHLSHEEFMQRLMSHMAVPRKPHYQMVGLYHGKCRDKLNQAREGLGQSAVKAVVEFNWQEFIGKQGKAACCGECGKPLNQLRAIENEVYLAALKFTTVH
jgi:hypothetical protein